MKLMYLIAILIAACGTPPSSLVAYTCHKAERCSIIPVTDDSLCLACVSEFETSHKELIDLFGVQKITHLLESATCPQLLKEVQSFNIMAACGFTP